MVKWVALECLYVHSYGEDTECKPCVISNQLSAANPRKPSAKNSAHLSHSASKASPGSILKVKDLTIRSDQGPFKIIFSVWVYNFY